MFTHSRIAVTTRVSAIIICLIAATAAAAASDIIGIPRIVDGDTIQIDAMKIRLNGIDAPETDQLCLDEKGLRWTCGITARDELVRHAGGKPWTCHVTGTDPYGRSLATCEVGSEDIEKWMVRSGWALSFVRYSHAPGRMMPRKAAAGQKEMLLPISGKRAAKQEAKKADKPAAARSRKRA